MSDFKEKLLNSLNTASGGIENNTKDFGSRSGNLVCPNCRNEFRSNKENTQLIPAPKGSGGCKARTTCPICGYEGCSYRDKPKPEPTPFSF